jgi:hypothetical protein
MFEILLSWNIIVLVIALLFVPALLAGKLSDWNEAQKVKAAAAQAKKSAAGTVP